MKKLSKPRVGILNPAFKYYGAADTDVARTFARVRRQMKLDEAKVAQQVRALPIRKAKA